MAKMLDRVSNLERSRCPDIRRWCRVIVEPGAEPDLSDLPAGNVRIILRLIVDPLPRSDAF